MTVLGSGFLAAALLAAYAFSQHRFFTVDEFQYIHATWLVSEGEVPYRDFYEHHFPLSYVLHAPLLWSDGSFPERALGLRLAVFLWWVGCVGVASAWAARLSGDAKVGLLAGALGLLLGFSAMSAIDFRADNFGAFLLLAGCAWLEMNRGAARRGRAILGGIVLALAIAMTQKMLFVVGATVVGWWAWDALRAREGRAPFLPRPGACLAGGLAVGALALALAAAFGVLASGFEITILQAIEHEALYPAVSGWLYWKPFLAAAPISSALLVLFAGLYFVLARDGFWGVPLAVSLLGGVLVQAQYPYNYVFPCLVVALLAARGFGLSLAWLDRRFERVPAWTPLLYLLAFGLAADQGRFLLGTTSNAHQLEILSKIERTTGPDDVVIDNSGGALFRPHASYYYHHGDAHRLMFEDYFRDELVGDYRESEALLWIMDYRLRELPKPVHDYFQRHYVRVDGSLFGLGFHLRRGGKSERTTTIEVVREGDYYVFPAPVKLSSGLRREPRETDLRLDGAPLRASRVHLDAGEHEVVVAAGAPGYTVTLIPPDAFILGEEDRFARELDGARAYQLLFEYEKP
jgi:hypothetical protein